MFLGVMLVSLHTIYEDVPVPCPALRECTDAQDVSLLEALKSTV